jgi:hypothetical protein
MNWLQRVTIHWGKIRAGSSRPWLNVDLIHQERARRCSFFLDTGAHASVAPLAYAEGLFEWDEGALRDSGLKDVHGRPLIGTPATLGLVLLFDYPVGPLRLRETIWFCEGIKNGLLGNRAFFEQLGAVFLPSGSEGRRFGLFQPPEAGNQPQQ